jgi:hypothetical protein
MLVIEFKQKLRPYFYKSHRGPQILETGLVWCVVKLSTCVRRATANKPSTGALLLFAPNAINLFFLKHSSTTQTLENTNTHPINVHTQIDKVPTGVSL